MQPSHHVFALVADFTHVAFSCAVDPLRIANLVSGKDLYSWTYASANGEAARASNDTVSMVHHRFDAFPPCDRLFVLSGMNIERPDPGHDTLITALRRAHRQDGAHIGALCSGAWLLARAGFLNGMKTAIHWDYHDAFMESFPEVNLVRNVFVADERHFTASGGSATADLMLHLIEREHGYDLSVAVADQMVYSAVRDATSAQRVSLQSRAGIRNPHLASAIEQMRAHIDDPVSPALIAKGLGISTRQLERLFGKYLNTSPKKYFMEMRLERARHLLLQTEMSVTEVAIAYGFESPGHFARVYRGSFGVTPVMQRGRMS